MTQLEMFKHNWKPNYSDSSYECFCFRTDLNKLVEEIRADERNRILKLVSELKSRYESFKHEEYYVSAMVADLEDLEEEINEFMDLH